VIITRPNPRGRASATSIMLGVSVLFTSTLLANGERTLVAHVPDEPEDKAKRVRYQAEKMDYLTVYSDEEWAASGLTEEPPLFVANPPAGPRADNMPPAATADEGAIDMLRRQAVMQGWTAEDLASWPTSTAEFNAEFTAAGYSDESQMLLNTRGERTGLLLAEMAMTQPPELWAENAAHSYPWDDSDWKRPGVGAAWKTPMVPPKAQPDDDDTKLDPDPTPPEPGTIDAPKAAGTITELDPDDPNASGGLDDPGGVDTALLVEHWGDDLDGVVEVFNAHRTEGGDPPSMSKLNYWLPKSDLPRARKATFPALVAYVASLPVP